MPQSSSTEIPVTDDTYLGFKVSLPSRLVEEGVELIFIAGALCAATNVRILTGHIWIYMLKLKRCLNNNDHKVNLS
jgi:hypothetical protein